MIANDFNSPLRPRLLYTHTQSIQQGADSEGSQVCKKVWKQKSK